MTVKWWSVLVALACCSIRRTMMAARLQDDLRLRPMPSNDPGAVPDLIEIPNPALDPRPTDLNTTVLLAKLGAKFDANYMSVQTPEHLVPIADIPFRSVLVRCKYFETRVLILRNQMICLEPNGYII